MRRREFITLLGSATAAWPFAARGQQVGAVRRVGVLMNLDATEPATQTNLMNLIQGLQLLGWNEGRNIHIEVRWSAGDAELARIYAAQLIGLMPDVIVAVSTTNLTVVRQATSTIPVIFLQVSDPVAQGFVANMSKPGGNITGFSFPEFAVAGKWLRMLKEIAPRLLRVGVMFNPETSPQSKFYVQAIETAAPSLGVQPVTIPVRATADIEPAVISFAREPNGSLILPTDTFTSLRSQLLADLALRHRLPMFTANSYTEKNGALIFYNVTEANMIEQVRGAASYIDRILKGARPGDLPVQAPTKFQLVINLRTAKALGLTVPPTLLAIADEVIE
jgi:putative ABC transport system substrate-binding protein